MHVICFTVRILVRRKTLDELRGGELDHVVEDNYFGVKRGFPGGEVGCFHEFENTVEPRFVFGNDGFGWGFLSLFLRLFCGGKGDEEEG